MSIDPLVDYLVTNGEIQKKTAIYYLKHIQFIYSEAETNWLTGFYAPILIVNHTKIIETIKNLQHVRQWNPRSIINYYKSLVKICKVFRNYYGESHTSAFDDALKEYQKIYVPLNNEDCTNRNEHKRTKAQSENWKEWEEILKDRDAQFELIKDYDSSSEISTPQYTEVLSYVISCIYTILPPRRILDYQHMRLCTTQADANDTECNYYAQKDKVFIFNVYKNAKGPQIIKVPKRLCKILNWYISEYHPYYKHKEITEYGKHYLILNHLGKQVLSSTITYCLNKVFKKKISINMLRHIYITCNLGEAIEKVDEAAKIMSHNSSTQKNYIIYN